MLREPLKDRAAGRWPGILSALGVPARALTGRHTSCPLCVGGKDRFRFDNKGGRGTWICLQCGAGDGIELVKRVQGCDFKKAAVLIEVELGDAPVQRRTAGPERTDGQKSQEMSALWKRGQLMDITDLAGQYLHARTGLKVFPSCLRFSPDERYTEAGKRASWHPVMVAKVCPSDAAVAAGEKATLHRTYLGTDAAKADVASPRKMMGTMPTGAAVRLQPHEDVLGIAEGIETALSASILFNVPCWAALAANLLQEWTPPTGVTTVFVFGDNDASNTGQAAAYGLAQKLKAKGLDVIVEIPGVSGQDWNDVLLRKMEGAR